MVQGPVQGHDVLQQVEINKCSEEHGSVIYRPFQEIMTYRPTDRPTNQPTTDGHQGVTLPILSFRKTI